MLVTQKENNLSGPLARFEQCNGIIWRVLLNLFFFLWLAVADLPGKYAQISAYMRHAAAAPHEVSQFYHRYLVSIFYRQHLSSSLAHPQAPLQEVQEYVSRSSNAPLRRILRCF
ncbi:hypothetical protein VTO73DRAFT_6442 [Trametes versicolor]